jgi:hypothetical protein
VLLCLIERPVDVQGRAAAVGMVGTLTPMLTVTGGLVSLDVTALRIRSPISVASCAGVSGSSTANSSPPYRAAKSFGRIDRVIHPAISIRASSPAS